MKKELIRTFSRLASGTVLVSLLLCAASPAWAGQDHNDTSPAADATSEALSSEAENPVTLDWYINFSWFATTWGEDAVSQAITEKTGVNIRFLSPSGSETEKLKALISSDSLPDLITLDCRDELVDELSGKGLVYALNELADQYDPVFWDCANEAAVSWHTGEDGSLYCYPNSYCTPQDYEEHDNISANQTFLVRKDIYEAIGSPDMTTPEGFSAAVKKAAELYPEINGEPLIPIGAHEFTSQGCDSFDRYLMNFLAVPYEKEGGYYDRYTDPDYLTWLKTFRQLAEEGYLKSDIFLDQRVQMEEKLAKGQYFCMIYQWTDMADQQKLLYASDPDSIYMAVDGPKNSAGDDPVLAGSGMEGWTLTFISKNCRYPDKAISLMTYLLSEEGQKMVSLGIEGVTYEIQDGQAVWLPDAKLLMNTDRTAYDRKYGADNTYWMLQYNVRQLDWMPEPEEPIRQLQEWTYPYSRYVTAADVNFSSGTPAGTAWNNIENLWGETLPSLLLASSDEEFDQILSDFTARRETMGYDLVKEEFLRQCREIREKLGITEETAP